MMFLRRSSRRSGRPRLLSVVVTLVVAFVALVITAGSAFADDYPTATDVGSIPTVGPLFFDGLANDHGCSADVIAAPSRDLVLTAAHCIEGTGAGITFAPGYLDGATPYGSGR